MVTILLAICTKFPQVFELELTNLLVLAVNINNNNSNVAGITEAASACHK